MIDLLLQGLLACVMIPEYDEFEMCVNNIVEEFVLDE